MLRTPPYERKLSPLRQFDYLLATNVMGWEQWQGDWYTPWDPSDQSRKYRYESGMWRPTECAQCAELVWIKCLVKAHHMGYKITQEAKDGKFHINGDHPVAKRLLVVDVRLDMAICRFAAILFDFTPPDPYTRP